MLRRSHQIEARSADIAGLDPVHPLVTLFQMIMIVMIDTRIRKPIMIEVRIKLRVMHNQSRAQNRHIMRGRDLLRIGQPRRIAEQSPAHPQRMSLLRHKLREPFLAAAQSLAQHNSSIISRFRHNAQNGILHPNMLPRAQPQFGRRLIRSVFRNRQRLIQRQPPRLQGLKSYVHRHHLGQRRRMAQTIRLRRVNDVSRIRLDHNIRIARALIDSRRDMMLFRMVRRVMMTLRRLRRMGTQCDYQNEYKEREFLYFHLKLLSVFPIRRRPPLESSSLVECKNKISFICRQMAMIRIAIHNRLRTKCSPPHPP